MVAYTRYVYDGYGDISFKVISRYVDGALADMIERPVYTYTNGTWSHMLTDYNGQAITYDAIGNPLSYRGATLTWQNGRQLATYTKGETSISYTYDADGLRTSKTVNGVKHDYYYLDGKLVYEGIGTDDILYYYDSYGTFAGLQYFPNGSNGVMYYAATNMQGDVIGLYDSTGALVVSYEYDAWGKLLSITDTTTIGIGAINPIRYRSYYYDSETGLYYLQSRYYDPETCRFINADGYVSTGQGVFGHNPYLYCANNPVNRVDSTGDCYGYANDPNLNSKNSGVEFGYYCGNYGYHVRHARSKEPRTKASYLLVEHLKEYEIFSPVPYDDGYGNMTIGYGHVILPGESFTTLTEAQATQLLAQDLQYAEHSVTRYSQQLQVIWDVNQYDAFVSLAFNSGDYFKGVMNDIQSGVDPVDAFGAIIYARGQKSLGLYRRRMDEADMFLYGIYERTYRNW